MIYFDNEGCILSIQQSARSNTEYYVGLQSEFSACLHLPRGTCTHSTRSFCFFCIYDGGCFVNLERSVPDHFCLCFFWAACVANIASAFDEPSLLESCITVSLNIWNDRLWLTQSTWLSFEMTSWKQIRTRGQIRYKLPVNSLRSLAGEPDFEFAWSFGPVTRRIDFAATC